MGNNGAKNKRMQRESHTWPEIKNNKNRQMTSELEFTEAVDLKPT